MIYECKGFFFQFQSSPHFIKYQEPYIQYLFEDPETDNTLNLKLTTKYPLKQSCGVYFVYIPPTPAERQISRGRIVHFTPAAVYLWNQLQKLDTFNLPQAAEILQQYLKTNQDQSITDCKSLLNEWYIAELIIKS